MFRRWSMGYKIGLSLHLFRLSSWATNHLLEQSSLGFHILRLPFPAKIFQTAGFPATGQPLQKDHGREEKHQISTPLEPFSGVEQRKISWRWRVIKCKIISMKTRDISTTVMLRPLPLTIIMGFIIMIPASVPVLITVHHQTPLNAVPARHIAQQHILMDWQFPPTAVLLLTPPVLEEWTLPLAVELRQDPSIWKFSMLSDVGNT